MSTNCAVYQRVSDGTDRSVEQQNAANEAAATERGWRTTGYSDPVSASRYSKKARPGWDALTDAVAAGKYAYVILWEPSRGDRKLSTWAAFLDSCRETGTGIYITNHGRLYDIRNGRDWRSLAEDGVDSAYETEKTSDRSRRGVQDAVDRGLPTGRIPYGYKRSYTHEPARAKPLPHQEPDPDEAPLVAEIIGRISQSEAISAIVKDLARRGKTTRAGGPWSRSSVVRLVTDGVVYIGKRRHNGDPLQDGDWEPIVDADVYWRAVAVLRDPARKPKGGGIRPGHVRWLLSYIATCSECDGPLSMRHLPRTTGQIAYYRCVNGCVLAPVADLDEMATVAVVGVFSSPALYESVTRGDDRQAQAARDEAEAEAGRLADFEEQAVKGEISAHSFTRIAKGIEARISELDKRAKELAVPPVIRDLVGDTEGRQEDIYERWLAMPLTGKRKVIATMFTPVLCPAGHSGTIRVRDRFSMKLKDSS